MWMNYIGVTQDVVVTVRRVAGVGKDFAEIRRGAPGVAISQPQMHRSAASASTGRRAGTGCAIGVSGPSPIRHNGRVTTGKRSAPGRHAGPARLEELPTREKRSFWPLLLLALGITAAVVAWGYLVYLAIDFGTAARDGDSTGWWMLALATVGAIACLFVGMMLVTRLFARIRAGQKPPEPPRAPGGRRALR
jgi:hypothetical protein